MKNIILGIAIAAMTLVACNNSSNKSTESQNSSNNTQAISQTDNKKIATSSTIEAKNAVSITAIVNAYLLLKKCLH